jgi:hypothetical protein
VGVDSRVYDGEGGKILVVPTHPRLGSSDEELQRLSVKHWGEEDGKATRNGHAAANIAVWHDVYCQASGGLLSSLSRFRSAGARASIGRYSALRQLPGKGYAMRAQASRYWQDRPCATETSGSDTAP